jgi:hypothetical protein
MPNHVTTRLTVTGPKSEVHRFVDKATAGGKSFDCNNLVPMPRSLINTRSPVVILTPDVYRMEMLKYREKCQTLPKNQRVCVPGITQKMHDYYMKRFGAADWYNWAIKNWGTKWGVYDCSDFDVMTIPNSNNCEAIATIFYLTAWCPATEFYLTVSAMFPKLTFKHEFAEEGGFFWDGKVLWGVKKRKISKLIGRVLKVASLGGNLVMQILISTIKKHNKYMTNKYESNSSDDNKSKHSTTKRERQQKFLLACQQTYKQSIGEGRLKRKYRQLMKDSDQENKNN